MTFSIIIPVYNVEKYLNECVDSVLNQKNVDYEIILVDDGSTDNSRQICDEYVKNHSNISVIHKQNGGASDARNVGIEEAEGDYILFIDSDDKIEKNSLSKINEVIINQKFPDIVMLEVYKYFDNNGTIISLSDGVNEDIDILKGKKLFEYLSNLPKYPASPCSKAIKRQLFIDNDLKFVKNLTAEDLEWCIRLFICAKSFAYCPYKYYYYRQARNGSVSNSIKEKNVLDILKTFIKWTNYAVNIDDASKKTMICCYMEYVSRFLILYYDRLTLDNRKLVAEELKKRNWIFGYRKDFVSKCINYSYKMFGIKITGKFLNIYLSIR